MNDHIVIDFRPTLDPIVIALQSDTGQVAINLEANVEQNIVLEFSPALFMSASPDTTDYLMYYLLSKG